jgi:hypothetical protein
MTDKPEGTHRQRPVIGDWVGSLYSMGGDRWDWRLSLFRNGSYERTAAWAHERESAGPPKSIISERGTWSIEENHSVLVLAPADGAMSHWGIRDVTGCERANTLLVLREAILASRNLPILLYRVHLNPKGPPTPYDAYGFPK